MKKIITASLLLMIMLVLPSIGSAQIDKFGELDTLIVESAKIDDMNWSLTVQLWNDENIEGLSIPLKIKDGLNKIVADSVIFAEGRAEQFSLKKFRCDTTIQCVTLGLVANLGPTKKMITAGKGRIATIFVSSLEDKPIENLEVDTTTTHPNNTLMAITSRFQGKDLTDTIPITEHKIREILPAFVFIKPEK